MKIPAIIRRLSVRVFRDSINILPAIRCDREPECFGYPGCVWISAAWLRWSIQIALHTRPCVHCIGFQPIPLPPPDRCDCAASMAGECVCGAWQEDRP
jgi:hypothetical protein